MPKVIKRGVQDPKQESGRPARARKPIAKKEVVEARATARNLRAEAEVEASRIIEDAKAEAATLRQRGYDEGYQEGLGQYTEKTVAALREVERFKTSVEPEYIRLLVACVRKVIGEELVLNPEAIVGVVREALKDATQQREVNVRVHPDDVAAVREHERRLIDALARANNIEIREDDNVGRGGCVIMTELGTIDASLERQLKALETVLEHELVQGEPEVVDPQTGEAAVAHHWGDGQAAADEGGEAPYAEDEQSEEAYVDDGYEDYGTYDEGAG